MHVFATQILTALSISVLFLLTIITILIHDSAFDSTRDGMVASLERITYKQVTHVGNISVPARLVGHEVVLKLYS